MEISRRIIDYSMWYYLRYYPSKLKLTQKLKEKFWIESENGKKYWWINEETIEYILNEKMRNIIQEEEVCRAKIKNLVGKNKKISYIKNNLRQKLFSPEMIENILNKDFEYHEKSIFNLDKLKKKITELQRKWKSILYIKQNLIEREQDRECVEGLILEIFPDGDSQNIVSEFEKYKEKISEKKLIEKLLRKWFMYGDIKQLLENDRI